MGRDSPFFRAARLPVDWVEVETAVAHPHDDGSAVTLERSIEETAAQLGPDERRYVELVTPLVEHWGLVEPVLLGPHPPSPRAVTRLLRASGPRYPRVVLADAAPSPSRPSRPSVPARSSPATRRTRCSRSSGARRPGSRSR